MYHQSQENQVLLVL